MCSISLQEFRNVKIAIGLESRGFLVKKKPQSKEQSKENDEERQEDKELKGKGEDRKIVTLCVYPYSRLKLISGKDWK